MIPICQESFCPICENHENRKFNSKRPCRKAWNLAGEDKPIFESTEISSRKNQIYY